MPGFVVHLGAQVQCSHGAPATPTVTNPKVLVGAQPIVTMPNPWTIAGCPQAGVPAPFCATGQWTVAAQRVFSNGQPLVLLDSQSTCTATGLPMVIMTTQQQVTGS